MTSIGALMGKAVTARKEAFPGTFRCHRCNTHAQQIWVQLRVGPLGEGLPIPNPNDGVFMGDGLHTDKAETRKYYGSLCTCCDQYSIWAGAPFDTPSQPIELVYPNEALAPPPSPDLPESVRQHYSEAATIAGLSHRAAAALLRVAVEELCRQVTDSNDKLANLIQSMVNDGLIDETTQHALGVVRVIGNSAVHPGQILTDDKPEHTRTLFDLVNLIAEATFTRKRKVQAMLNTLPENERQRIVAPKRS